MEEQAENAMAKAIVDAAKKSMGSPIEDKVLKEVQLLALNALNIKEERIVLEKFIESEMQDIAPNFSKIAGPMLAARMLEEAGSIKKLALMPSSTIQMLGAEKALFRHLKNHSVKPPKHGLIFMHSLIQKAGRDNRGKMARALAGKLSIAVRADYFDKRDISKGLQESLDKRFAQLKK